jgi:acyl-CoA synthetase (NDP forming)
MLLSAPLRTTAVSDDELRVFSNPASVAVVGASADHAKWGYWLAQGALRGLERRSVYFINRAGSKIGGQQSHPSLSALPEVPELVAISVPGPAVMGVIREALKLGSRAFLVVSARVDDEAEILALLRAHNARMIGPNSLGIYSAEGELQLMWGDMRPGSLAIVSQSGQLGSEIAALGETAGVGISRFISLGNQGDVHAADVLRSLANDQQTRTVGMYLEDFARGQELFAAIGQLREAGLAVVLLTTGESDASRDLAQSHTGAMTSSTELIDAACRASGALRVHTPSELVQIAAFVERQPAPLGPRIAVISDSGGQGGIAADAATRVGLVLPELSRELRDHIETMLPEGASSRNPIDLAGAGEAGLSIYAELTRVLAASGEVDAVVLSGYFGSYGKNTPALLDAERAVALRLTEQVGAPVMVHAMAPDSQISQELHAAGVPVNGRIEDVLAAISGAWRAASPLPANLAADGAPIAASDQITARQQLAAVGIPFPLLHVVRTADEAVAAAAELDCMVVLKAAWLAHKTEHGGVRLGLVGEEAVRAAFTEMHASIGDGDYTIEAQDTREHVAEFIVAARRDPAFGPTITVGYGGTETEIWQDLALEMAPVGPDRAAAMIDTLRSSRLLGPWRGRPALAADALAAVVATLSQVLAASHAIREIELNPVRVGVDGAIAVDCLTIFED